MIARLLGLVLPLALTTIVHAGILDASWAPPTTNTDGSALTDLAGFRIYYDANTASPCPTSAFLSVVAASPAPRIGDTAGAQLVGLTAGMLYNVSITALDLSGLESTCSQIASAVARSDTPPPPPPPPSDTTPPTIVITGSTVAGMTATISGLAADNVGVTKVTWASNRGGSGFATGTTSWAATVPIRKGMNTITMTAFDAAGNSKAQSVTLKGR